MPPTKSSQPEVRATTLEIRTEAIDALDGAGTPRISDGELTEYSHTMVLSLQKLALKHRQKDLARILGVAAANLQWRSEIDRHSSKRKTSEENYRGLLEAAPDAMLVVSRSGQIVLLNIQAEKQFGYSREELVGQHVKIVIPDGFSKWPMANDLQSVREELAQQIGAGIELSARRKDGSEFPIEIALSPLEYAEEIQIVRRQNIWGS